MLWFYCSCNTMSSFWKFTACVLLCASGEVAACAALLSSVCHSVAMFVLKHRDQPLWASFFFFQHLNLLQHCPLEGTSSDRVNILFHIYINNISITLYSVLLPYSEEDAPVKSSCLLPVRRWDRRQGYVNCLLPLSERMERVLLAFSWVVSEIAFREGVKLSRECCCPNSSRFSTVMDSIWCGESSSMVQRVQLAAGVLKQTMEPR